MSYYSENIVDESNTSKYNDISDFNIQHCIDYDINELKNLKNNLANLKVEYTKKEKLCESNIEAVKKMICKKCNEDNNGHIWTNYREPCMYGEKYSYCKNCGKDMYSNCIYDLSSFY